MTTRTPSTTLRGLTCLLALLLAPGACSNKRATPSPPELAQQSQALDRFALSSIAPAALESRLVSERNFALKNDVSVSAGAQAQTQAPVARPTSHRIIRHGNQTIEVARVDAALDTIRRIVSEFGGYTTDETHRQDDRAVNTVSITCRVPAGKLDEAIARVRQLGTQEELSITAQDVSEAYADLEIEMANQKKLEARLLDLLNRQTNRLTDLLEIERETARVRGAIDQLEGRKRFWDNQLDLSTLVVALHEPRPAIASAGGGPWRTIRQAFGDAGDNFVLTIAGIISALGAAVPLLGAVVIVFVALRGWRRRRRAAKALHVSGPVL